MTYTKKDLEDLKTLMALWEQGDDRVDIALRLWHLGWVQQISVEPVAFQLTDEGRRALERIDP